MIGRDVVVLGGGPAGLAVGIALVRRGRSVMVLERTRYERPRAGETFGGELGPLLRELGAWDDFAALSPLPFRGVESSWGGPSLVGRPSIFHPFGDGWHVDRARFDRALAACAVRFGVELRDDVGVSAPSFDEGVWTVRPERGEALKARYLIDASGRGAPATGAHFRGRRWLRVDRQIALLGSMAQTARAVEPVLVLEPVREGWWYSVPQPDGCLLCVLITDSDLLPARGHAALAEHFLAALGASSHTAERAEGASLAGPPWIARSDSGLLVPSRGLAWRALGDAAMGCDPLAGDGVVRALRAALDGAPEIHLELERPDPTVGALVEPFREFLERRARYYEREARFADAPFWLRRRPLPWQSAPLYLEPERVLSFDGAALDRAAAAEVEALLPPSVLRSLLERLRTPTPAHEAMTFLRALAPLEDRRLLVALQLLVARDAIRAA